MKILITLLVIIAGFSAQCDPGKVREVAPSTFGDPGGAAQKTRELLQYQAQQRAIADEKQRQANAYARATAMQRAELDRIYSKDPWRVIEGKTNLARGTGWVEFQGNAQEIRDGGTIFEGKFGQVLDVRPTFGGRSHTTINRENLSKRDNLQSRSGHESVIADTSNLNYGEDNFYVANFPFPATKDYKELMAYNSGYYTYKNADGQNITLPRLDYGLPCVKVFSPEELEAQAKAAAPPPVSKKQMEQARLFKVFLKKADEGDASYMLRVAECYRDGEGVDQDIVQARNYFGKAAAAGSPTAADELEKLNRAYPLTSAK